MYSILIRNEADATKWTYMLDENEAVWEGSKADAQAKVQALLATITLNRIKVVHNTTLTAAFTIDDVE
jgi:hypothetical protein